MKAVITLEYNGEQVKIDFLPNPGQTWDEFKDFTHFWWSDGNDSCDCNRSRAGIRAGADWPELDCGETEVNLINIAYEGEPI